VKSSFSTTLDIYKLLLKCSIFKCIAKNRLRLIEFFQTHSHRTTSPRRQYSKVLGKNLLYLELWTIIANYGDWDAVQITLHSATTKLSLDIVSYSPASWSTWTWACTTAPGCSPQWTQPPRCAKLGSGRGRPFLGGRSAGSSRNRACSCNTYKKIR
jgi:hypothetical protein